MEWFSGALAALGLLPPAPGTEEHIQLQDRVRLEYLKEIRKSEGERDDERVRQLRIKELRLMLEHTQWAYTELEQEHWNWRTSSCLVSCCAGAKHARKRVAASCAARAAWFRSRDRQLQTELSALMEHRPVAIAEVPYIELPVEVVEEMRSVPAKEICQNCEEDLYTAASQEDLLTRQALADTDAYRQLGMLAEHLAAAAGMPDQKERKKNAIPPLSPPIYC